MEQTTKEWGWGGVCWSWVPGRRARESCLGVVEQCVALCPLNTQMGGFNHTDLELKTAFP